jgi:pathogenesis-related protein 1
MRRVAVVAFLAITVGCSSKGDSPQDGGGAGGALGEGGTAADGAIGFGGQTGSSGGMTGGPGTGGGKGSGGKSGSTGGTIGTGGRSPATGGLTGSGGKVGATGGKTGSGGKSGGSGGVTGTGGQSPGTGGMTGTDGGATHTNPLSQALIDEFVTAHNQARSGTLNPPPSPALPPVSWDPILADSAYNYLVKCKSSGTTMVDHNANRSSDYVALGGSGYVGENIYAMQGAAAKPTDAVDLWMSEASSYDYATNTGDAGHYTQVVWRDSVHIGCAIVTCSAMKYSNTILCDYSPGGNMNGKKPY